MSWSSRRQFFYGTIVVITILFFVFLTLYPYFNKAPSCVDRKQNGDETGVDCGGSCSIACNKEVNEIDVLWARSFRVVEGRYNAVAYLENKNPDAAVYNIKYRFRFGDQNNLFIGKREGETFIPPKGKFAIFEPAVDVGNSVPVYTTLEFLEAPVWVKIPEEKVNQMRVSISNIVLENQETTPRLSATIRNNSLFYIPDIKVVAILYDALGNAISVSQTYLEELRSSESAGLFFTWPEPIKEEVVEKELIPMYNVFLSKIK